MKLRNILLAILVVAVALGIEILMMGYYQKSIEVVKNPIVTMEIKDFGKVKMELYPDKAPNTVANFIQSINDGVYNGSTYHRIIPNVLIQGGKAVENSEENSENSYSDFGIKGEFAANGFIQNNLKHVRGTLSMARADYSTLDPGLTEEGYNSASTQFFICLTNCSGYDGMYAGFGKVIEGIDVIEKISNTERKVNEGEDINTTQSETPAVEPVITSMSVNTFGVDYGKPERNKAFDYSSYIMQRYMTTSTSTMSAE